MKFEDQLKSKLIGKWGGLGEKNPVWEFTKDSLYYFQQKKSQKYYLRWDTLFVQFSNRDTVNNFGILDIEFDTLKLTDFNYYNFKTFGYRFK